MKKLFGILIVLSLVSSAAVADLISDDFARVVVTVNPTIAVDALEVVTDVLAIQQGNEETSAIEAIVTFNVESNVQLISMYVCATDLWKGNATGQGNAIPLDQAIEASVVPAMANATDGDNTLAWTGPGGTLEGLPAACTETKCFESQQNNEFNQEVDVTVVWDSNLAGFVLPTGLYSGYVQLVALTGCAQTPGSI